MTELILYNTAMKTVPFTIPSQVSCPTEIKVKKITASSEKDSDRVSNSPLLHFKVKIMQMATSPMFA
jgi:hypothetical protein